MAFKKIKKALIQAPALGPPDMAKPFYLYVHERKGMATGVLVQMLGSWYQPVAYLSEQVDLVAIGWPPCFKVLATTALLAEDANKLTFGQKLIIWVPHTVVTLMEQRGHCWLSNPWMLRYQGLLCENPYITLETVNTLNLATLLPIEYAEHGKPPLYAPGYHCCIETVDEVFSSQKDLKDQPLKDSDIEYFTDGSSFISEGIRKARYAVVRLSSVTKACPLLVGTSAQKAELIALTRAPFLVKGKSVNIYTDSRFAFATLHAHGAIYKERGLLTTEGKKTKNKKEIEQLLEAVWAPKEVAVIHCKGHQTRGSDKAIGNRKADKEAKKRLQ
nr:uncharacterized protein LOC105484438 [Macaca nemestrina]XP_011744310.1 uncharacterized protein LOC105484438 [Macaca nemestrina]XP_011744311.1 uncharacterized protein LOC105484438 [Macaca nemestrina]